MVGRATGALASNAALRDIPLSDSPRGRRPFKVVPTLASLSEPLIYEGAFRKLQTRLVGLHARKTYDLAKEIHLDQRELELEHEMLNEHDPHAVGAYLRLDNGERELVGYMDADDSRLFLAQALDGAAVLRARPTGNPWSGRSSKGGSMDVEVYLAQS